jgi:hypothetical protein
VRRFLEELKVISLPVWAIAAVVCGVVVGYLVNAYDTSGGDAMIFWAFPGFILFVVLPIVLFVYILLVGYVYHDARRRGMRYVLWTFLAIFIPSSVGFILYFILREPLLRTCPRCGTSVAGGFPYCSACGGTIARTCPECRRPIETGWSHCARCGARLAPPVRENAG